MPKAAYGINPVTIRGKDQYGRNLGLTLSRLWIGTPDGKVHKPMCACMSLLGHPELGIEDNDRDPEACEPIAVIKVDEETMVSGLYHLFPQGELDHAGDKSPGLNYELLQAVQELVRRLSKHGEDVSKYQSLLDRIGIATS